MALMDEGNGNGMVMPVSPMMGNGGGFGGFGGDWAWIIVLFILFGFNGNGFNRGGNGAPSGDVLYPWMNQAQTVTSGIGDIQNALTAGFAGVNSSIVNAQMALAPQLYSIQSSLQQCCCENRAAIADVKYTIATEACSDRAAVNAGVQRILDQLCQDKIDAKNEKIADLERQLTAANLAASQTAQTSRILADNAAQTVALEQYLNPVPVPAYVVQNPNCCSQNFGCSCA